MARDNLFVRQVNAPAEASPAPFSSSEDVNVARAFADVLMTQGEKWNLTSLSSLHNRFRDAQAGDQFTAWMHGNMNAIVPDDKLEKALGTDLLKVVCEHSGLPEDRFHRRLAYVLPILVRQVSAQELADSARAFLFNLSEFRNRLVSSQLK